MDKPTQYRVINSGRSGIRATAPMRRFEKRWNRLLGQMIEVDIGSHSHFNVAKLTTSPINRILFTSPGSRISTAVHNAGVVRSPVEWYSEGISDHAPIFWNVSPRTPNSAKSGGISKGVLGSKNPFEIHSSFAVKSRER